MNAAARFPVRAAAQLRSRDAALRTLFPPEVEIALSDPRKPQPTLWPGEVPTILNARPARVREFSAGRTAARAAMVALGTAPAAIPAGTDCAPIWPALVTGSISHCADICIAALARCEAVRAVGADLEEATPLEPDLMPRICTLAERAWLASQPEETRAILAKLIFSAKECAYKCQYPLTGTLFDFDTLEITPDLDTGQFEATFTRAIGEFGAGACLPGRFVIEYGLIGCGMTLGRGPRWGLGQG
jgi:4'-phosphopantetheinyl transferase EntD